MARPHKQMPGRTYHIIYQIRAVKARLEAFSVVTEDLDIHKT